AAPPTRSQPRPPGTDTSAADPAARGRAPAARFPPRPRARERAAAGKAPGSRSGARASPARLPYAAQDGRRQQRAAEPVNEATPTEQPGLRTKRAQCLRARRAELAEAPKRIDPPLEKQPPGETARVREVLVDDEQRSAIERVRGRVPRVPPVGR